MEGQVVDETTCPFTCRGEKPVLWIYTLSLLLHIMVVCFPVLLLEYARALAGIRRDGTMELSENAQNTLLLAITALLFILFTTGLAVPSTVPDTATVIPSA